MRKFYIVCKLALAFSAVFSANVCTSMAASTVSKQEAEDIVSSAFHTGKIEKAQVVTSSSNTNEWSILYANGATALVSMSGVIERFLSLPTASSAKGSTSDKQAVIIAQNLIKKLDPSHYQSVELDPMHPDVLNGGQYTVSFTRMVNGTPFPADGVQVKVNKDGSVGFYQRTWTSGLVFPQKTGLLSKNSVIQRADRYLTSSPQATLFYYMVPWDSAPQLLYLVQTKGGQIALYAKDGNLVTAPGSSASIFKLPWYQIPWVKWTGGGIVFVLVLGAVFWIGFKQGKRGQHRKQTSDSPLVSYRYKRRTTT